jgi:hypothetical protein
VAPLELPFYNFVCYTLDLLHHFANSVHDITLTIFLVDHHVPLPLFSSESTPHPPNSTAASWDSLPAGNDTQILMRHDCCYRYLEEGGTVGRV